MHFLESLCLPADNIIDHAFLRPVPDTLLLQYHFIEASIPPTGTSGCDLKEFGGGEVNAREEAQGGDVPTISKYRHQALQ